MSFALRKRIIDKTGKEPSDKMTRDEMLSFVPEKKYNDGRTKQAYKDECNIQKIMARAEKAGTISHLEKFQGQYADFSDFDFQEQTQMLTRGREIFDELPAEVRQEFGQSPAAFFAYVNDPANTDDLLNKMPALAAPGRQLLQVKPPTADEAARAAAGETQSNEQTPAEASPAATTPEANSSASE